MTCNLKVRKMARNTMRRGNMTAKSKKERSWIGPSLTSFLAS